MPNTILNRLNKNTLLKINLQGAVHLIFEDKILMFYKITLNFLILCRTLREKSNMAASSDPPVNIKVKSLANDAKIFKFIMGPGTDVMKAVFITIYSDPEMETNDGKMTLNEYFCRKFSTETKAKSEIKKICGNLYKESDCFNKDLMEERFDISFYYALILKIEPEFTEKRLSVNSTSEIKKLKNRRNSLAHQGAYSKIFPLGILDDLEKEFMSLLESVSNDFPTSNFINNAKISTMQLIQALNCEPNNINEFIQDKEKFLKDFKNNFILECQQELKNTRSFEISTDPFWELLKKKHNSEFCGSIDEVFTAPNITMDQKQVSFQNIFDFRDLKGEVSQVILISGKGGSGKSTLCNRVFNHWKNEADSTGTTDGLQKFDLLFFVPLRKTNSPRVKEYLSNELIANSMLDVENNNILIFLLSNLNVLFVIDGFDEKNDQGALLVKNIASRFSKCRVMITTRPEYLHEAQATFQNSSSITLNLEGFDESGQKEFAEKVITMDVNRRRINQEIDSPENSQLVVKRMHTKFCDFLENRGVILDEHLKLPLTVSLLILLWLDYQNDKKKMKTLEAISSATELYDQLFIMLREKLVRARMSFIDVSVDIVDLIFHLLCKLSLQQLNERTFLLKLARRSNELLKNEWESNGFIDRHDEFLSAFMVFEKIVFSNSRENTLFSFFHRTQMEYLAAVYISQEIIKSKENEIKTFLTCSDKRMYKQVLLFLTGRFNKKTILEKHCNEIVSLTSQCEVTGLNFNDGYNLITESGKWDCYNKKYSYNSKLCEIVADKLPHRNWDIEHEMLFPAVVLLTNCPIIINSLDINSRINSDPKQIRGLESALRDLKETRCLNQSAKPDLSFHILSHKMTPNREWTDKYLQFFLPWCNLVKFSGHVTSQSTKFLDKCTIIAVKISDIATHNAIVDCCSKARKLKRLTITPIFLDADVDIRSLKKFEPVSGNFNLNFILTNITHENLMQSISFVKNSSPR